MKKRLLMILILILVVLFGFGVSNEEFTKKDSIPIQEKKEELPVEEKDYSSDVVGTLYIPDTPFKATITQTVDNVYYLNHDVDGSSNTKGNPFLDYRDNLMQSKVLRIYGHNSRTINTEFRILEGYYKEKYYQEHPYIYFETAKDTKKYQVFSSYTEVKDWSYYNADFTNIDIYKQELTKYKSKSLYDTGVEVTDEDRILILQTCFYEKKYAKYKNKFLLIMAKEV